jgi:hypothetical protein
MIPLLAAWFVKGSANKEKEGDFRRRANDQHWVLIDGLTGLSSLVGYPKDG